MLNKRTADILLKACLGVGSFLAGSAFGLWLGGDGKCHICPRSDEYLEDEEDDCEQPRFVGYFGKDDDGGDIYSKAVIKYHSSSDYNSKPTAEEPSSYHETVEELEEEASYSETVEVHEDGTATVTTEYGDEEDAGPYIVSVDSYMNEYQDFSKNMVTYFEEDDVLCDERDEVIKNPEEYIGSDALDCFGDGSDDPNVVYVRNLRKHSDYEVIRDPGSYEQKVLGFVDEEEYRKARKALNLDEE